MAVKAFCDVCDIETKDVMGEFNSVEVNVLKPQKQPQMSKYIMCSSCARDAKQKVVELIQEKRKNESNV